VSVDLAWDDGQQAIVDALGQFCRDRCSDEVTRAPSHAFPVDLWRDLAELGVLATGTPEGDGGPAEIAAAMSALGRGSKGGIESGTSHRSPLARLFARPALSSFLPKIVYYFVLEDEDVEYVLSAVHSTLASEGGPDDCGRGLAIVSAIDAQYGIELELSPRGDVIEEDGTPLSSEKASSL